MMENSPNSDAERGRPKSQSEDELRRLYPHYDASCKYLENRPFIFRYGPLKLLYSLVADSFNSWRGQVRDGNSPTGWRERSEQEKRQLYREEEAARRNKRR
jgi:hypothetical protein